MRRTSKAASAKHASTHVKVFAVFLNHDVRSQLACTENTVLGLVDAHRLVYPAFAPRMRRVEFPALLGFIQRQVIRCVTINLVRRRQDEYSMRRKFSGRLQQY